MKHLSRSSRRIIAFFAFAISIISIQLLTAGSTFAATRTWDGSAGDGKFSTAANWSSDTAPVTGDTIVFSGQAGGSAGENILLINDLSGVALAGITVDTASPNVIKRFHVNTVTLQANATIGQAALGGGSGTDELRFSTTAGDGYYVPANGTVIAQGNLTVSYGVGLSAGVVNVAGNLTVTTRAVISSASSINGTITMPAGNFGLSFRGANATIPNDMTINAYGAGGNVSQLLFTDCTGGYTGGAGASGNLILCDTYATRTYTLSGTITLNSDLEIGIPNNTTVRVTGTVNYNGHQIVKSSTTSGSGVLQVVTTPGAPTDLVATPASGQVGLAWVAPTSDGFSTITDYIIEYKLHSAGSWSTFSDGTGTGTSTTITSLTNGSAYDFRVSAVNSKGTGTPVTITSITPAAAVTAPIAVTGISAAINSTTKHAILSWTAPASNGGSPITDYLIEVKLSSGSTWYTVSHSAFTVTEAEILSGLTDGQTYDFRISAINAQGTGPSATITNFLYNPGNGTSGDLSDAGAGVVGAPNTGVMNFATKNPLVIVGLGAATAGLLLFFAKRRRSVS